MDQVFAAFGKLIAGAADAKHWPFFSVMVTLSVLGHIMSTRVFTRKRAYTDYGPSVLGQLEHKLWHWGRETLPFHPFMVAIFVLCPLWPDPEGDGLKPIATANYWIFCATLSLFAWIIVKAIAKERGITLALPGESVRPECD